MAPIARQATRLGVRWLLIGAAGRDLVFEKIAGREPGRATYDVDVAVLVGNWDEYRDLKNALIREEGARGDPVIQQRVYLPNDEPLDLVPFGGLEQNATVAWPPGDDPVLNVRGLREAMEHSLTYHLEGGQEVQVPSIEMFVCLKLFAWKDRHVRKPRHDSVDLGEVLDYADDFIPLEELHDQHSQTFEANEWDPALTVLQVLGERLALILRPDTAKALSEILEAELDDQGQLSLLRELESGRAARAELVTSSAWRVARCAARPARGAERRSAAP